MPSCHSVSLGCIIDFFAKPEMRKQTKYNQLRTTVHIVTFCLNNRVHSELNLHLHIPHINIIVVQTIVVHRLKITSRNPTSELVIVSHPPPILPQEMHKDGHRAGGSQVQMTGLFLECFTESLSERTFRSV